MTRYQADDQEWPRFPKLDLRDLTPIMFWTIMREGTSLGRGYFLADEKDALNHIANSLGLNI